MEKMVCVLFLLTFVICAQGLSFNWYPNKFISNDTVCGVWICESRANDTVSADVDLSNFDTHLFKTILSISVFKNVGSRSIKDNPTRQEVLMISATRGSNGYVKQNRLSALIFLEPKGTEGYVKLEPSIPEDCAAEYTCVIGGLDSEGRDVMETAILPKRSNRNKNWADMNEESSETILDRIRSIVARSMAGLEEKIEAVQRDLLPKNDSSNLTLSSIGNKGKSDEREMFAKLIASNACEKGMLASFNHRFPYPVTFPKNTLNFPYPCDSTTDGGGWIVIQRRSTGDVNFNRNWDDYKNGFGSFAGDFWLGNEKIRTITQSGTYELRIDLVFDGASVYAHYNSFSIGEPHPSADQSSYQGSYFFPGYSSSSNRDQPSTYKLTIGDYKGTAGDSLRDNNGRQFSTSDRDQDSSSGNCAEEYKGGWWFVGCGYTCLNGEWGDDSSKGMEWRDLTGGPSVSFSEMKIRRRG